MPISPHARPRDRRFCWSEAGAIVHHLAVMACHRAASGADRWASSARKGDFIEADQSDLLPCPAPFAKIFLFSRNPNHFYIPRRPVPQRGVGHRHERWGGMRWTRAALKTRALSADGEVVWS